MKVRTRIAWILCVFLLIACDKGNDDPPQPAPPLNFVSLKVDGVSSNLTPYNIPTNPLLKFSFSAPVDRSTTGNSFLFRNNAGAAINYTITYERIYYNC